MAPIPLARDLWVGWALCFSIKSSARAQSTRRGCFGKRLRSGPVPRVIARRRFIPGTPTSGPSRRHRSRNGTAQSKPVSPGRLYHQHIEHYLMSSWRSMGLVTVFGFLFFFPLYPAFLIFCLYACMSLCISVIVAFYSIVSSVTPC